MQDYPFELSIFTRRLLEREAKSDVEMTTIYELAKDRRREELFFPEMDNANLNNAYQTFIMTLRDYAPALF